MIIGKSSDGEKRVKFHVDVHCTSCGKKVPGGMQTGKDHFQTRGFKAELEEFKKNYLCGVCRDKKRVKRD